MEVFSNVSIENVTDYRKALGASRDSLWIVVTITVFYVFIFIAGLIGNISTCIVIATNKSMHTATNYYLFSMAVSDLLLLITGMPPEMYMIWSRYPYIFGNTFCLLRGLFAETSTNATVLTITAFTVERYVAICHPFLSHTMSNLSRVVKLIILIWILAIGFAIPQAFQFGVIEMISDIPESTMCYVVNPIQYSFEASTILFFVLPMTLISVLYALICMRLRSSRMPSSNGDPKNVMLPNHMKLSCKHQQRQSSRRVIKMLVAVVVAFFLCFFSFHAQRLVAIYITFDSEEERQQYLKIYEVVTYISGVLYFVSTSINPLLYNIMSNKFREAFKETFARCCCLSRPQSRKPKRTYSALSRSTKRGQESSESFRDDTSLHTNTTLIRKSSTDFIILDPQGRRHSSKMSPVENLSSERGKQFMHWPMNRSEISMQITPNSNLDAITPGMKLVAVQMPPPPPPQSETLLKKVMQRMRSLGSDSRHGPSQATAGLYESVQISNSNLKAVDSFGLQNELANYMQEILSVEE